MGVETGAAHDFVVAEIGVALNQLRLEALHVNGSTWVSRMQECTGRLLYLLPRDFGIHRYTYLLLH